MWLSSLSLFNVCVSLCFYCFVLWFGSNPWMVPQCCVRGWTHFPNMHTRLPLQSPCVRGLHPPKIHPVASFPLCPLNLSKPLSEEHFRPLRPAKQSKDPAEARGKEAVVLPPSEQNFICVGKTVWPLPKPRPSSFHPPCSRTLQPSDL